MGAISRQTLVSDRLHYYLQTPGFTDFPNYCWLLQHISNWVTKLGKLPLRKHYIHIAAHTNKIFCFLSSVIQNIEIYQTHKNEIIRTVRWSIFKYGLKCLHNTEGIYFTEKYMCSYINKTNSIFYIMSQSLFQSLLSAINYPLNTFAIILHYTQAFYSMIWWRETSTTLS